MLHASQQEGSQSNSWAVWSLHAVPVSINICKTVWIKAAAKWLNVNYLWSVTAFPVVLCPELKSNLNQCRLGSFWLCQIRNFLGSGFGTDLSGRLFGLNTVTSEEHRVICGALVWNSPDNCKSRVFNLALSKLHWLSKSGQLYDAYFCCCEKDKSPYINQEMESEWINNRPIYVRINGKGFFFIN